MSGYDPLSPEGDPFYPPTVPTLVQCLHCGEAYDSYLIQWVVEPELQRGFWRCPVEGCDGAGFGFDIFPVDENFADERGTFGWTEFDDEEDEEDYLVCDGEGGDDWDEQEEEDWLQVESDDCIFSIDHDLPTDEDGDWSEADDDDAKDSDKSSPPAEQEARRQQRRRPRFDDDDIPF